MRKRSGSTGVGVLQSDAWTAASDAVVTGLIVGVLSLPLVSAPAALLAGIRHLDAGRSGRASTYGDLVSDTLATVRATASLLIGLAMAGACLLGSLVVAALSEFPGRSLWLWLMLGAAVLLLIALLLGISGVAVRGRMPTRTNIRLEARRRMQRDPSGAALVGAALVMCSAMVAAIPGLVVLLPGLILYALVAVSRRYERRFAHAMGVRPDSVVTNDG